MTYATSLRHLIDGTADVSERNFALRKNLHVNDKGDWLIADRL